MAADFRPNGVQSTRAKLIEHRTYLRPINEAGDVLETPQQAVARQINHQKYLWEQAKGEPLTFLEIAELEELRALLVSRKVSLSGRVKWMADTDVIKERPSAAFNCSFTEIRLPADAVDTFWLLLQGCGVGFKPCPGLMSGFGVEIREVEFVPSTREGRGGQEKTTETFDKATGEWRIVVGDSAKAWAKLIGKLLTNKYRARKLVIDLSELRPAGQRLRGYGWISSGWEPLKVGMEIIVNVMNKKAGKVLDAIDILDIVNALGTVLSSRRSAQICILEDDHRDIEAFKKAKDGYFEKGFWWRAQSNNSIMFNRKPTHDELEEIFKSIWQSGEPGFYNMEHARRRAPWAQGTNPCGEIILPSKGFCNLVQVVPHRMKGAAELSRAIWLAARANYRQTCVDMRDGVLQIPWNDNNVLLRLCGVSFTGYIAWEGADNEMSLQWARDKAVNAANSMADELGLNRSALVTQIQPAGTVSKVLGEEGDEVHEGAHGAIAKYIFNRVGFSKHDPLVQKLIDAGYQVEPNPYDELSGVLVTFPVEYSDPGNLFTEIKRLESHVLELAPGNYVGPSGQPIDEEDAFETILVNRESALVQLDRYKTLMDNYVQHNCSITVSFDEDEVRDIIEWLDENWDSFVGVSFLKRTDPTLTLEQAAARYGHRYLPQEPVSQSRFREYTEKLRPVDFATDSSIDGVDIQDCSTGACPIR